MKTVLVYTSDLLPWSETFIREQVLALRKWHGVLVGMRELHQLPLDGLEVCLLRPAKPNFSNRLQWKLSKWLGTVPRSTVRRLQKKRPLLLHVHFGS